MPTTISPQEFVNKWRQVTANEKKMAQSHFNDLCRLIGHATPLEADPKGSGLRLKQARMLKLNLERAKD